MNGPWRTWIGILALTCLARPAVAQDAKLVKLPSSPDAAPDATYYSYSPACYAEDPQRRSSGLTAGGSFLLVKPYFGSNTAYSTRTGITTPSPQQTATDFVW